MKIHKTSLIVAAALAGLVGTGLVARAADEAAPATKQKASVTGERGARAADRMQQMAKELNLTERQKAQLKPVLQKEAEKVKALREDPSLSREQRQAKLKAIRKDIAPELKKVLTPEQYEKWQKMREERQRRGGANGPKGAKGPNPAKL
jgi:Spy/CpxP family protein refolding chaperone